MTPTASTPRPLALADHRSRADRYAAILQRLTRSQTDIRAAVLVTADGFELATLERHDKPRAAQLAAMASSLISLAGAAGREVGHTHCERLFVESANGKLLVRPIGPPPAALLLCMALAPGMLPGAALWTADEIAKAVTAA